MGVKLNRLPDFVGRPLLCVTYSDRPLEPERCDLEFLRARYAKADRLPPSAPFESLLPLSHYAGSGGGIAIYDVGRDGSSSPRLVCAFRVQTCKPQHSIWHDGLVWVLGVDRVEIYDPDLRCVGVVTDPWLSGAHTIATDGNGCLLLSCSASDSVLWLDIASRQIVNAVRLPERVYGFNYRLSRTDSVVDHYITNDLQTTHVNCAWPWRKGVLTSSLIPGALGWFDTTGDYRELLRGMVGCHGARVRSDREELYCCDSCAGTLVFLDAGGRIVRRLDTDSHWLHDSLQLSGDLFATNRYDKGDVVLWDVATGTRQTTIDVSMHGLPQFLSFGS